MARVFHTGFEWQSVTDGMEHRTNIASPSIDTTIKHSGEASLRCSNASLAAGLYRGFDHLFAAQTVIYSRFYFYIDSQDDDALVSTTMDLFLGTTNALSVQIVRSGSTYTADTVINNYATSLGTFAVGIDAWHYIEIYYDTTPADGSEKVTVRYDGSAQITRTDLTLTSKTITVIQAGYYNGTAGAITGTDVYFDDIVVNNGTGTANATWVGGDECIAIMVPVGAGDNAATAGLYSAIDEIPPTTTDYIELDSNGVIADYVVTAPGTAGISGTITCVSVLCRIREEAAGTSSYQIRIKSASGGTVASTTAADAGNATPRTNPASTTAWLRPLYQQTDPTTGVAWTVTGTNSLTNMQIGVTNVDADSTPDIWIHAMAAMVGYIPSAGTTVVKDIIGGFGIIPFAR